MNIVRVVLLKMYKSINSAEVAVAIFTISVLFTLIWLSVLLDLSTPNIIGYVEIVYFLTNIVLIFLLTIWSMLWGAEVCGEEKRKEGK